MAVLKLPYYDYGACPFEGCEYGEWIANENLTILKEMNEASAISFQIQKGERVTAETGVVITTKPGIAKILRPFKIGKIDTKPGDQISILTNRGEGCFKVWFAGNLIDCLADIDGFYENKGAIEFTQDVKNIWWVKIINSKGKVGWSNQPKAFDKKDRYK